MWPCRAGSPGSWRARRTSWPARRWPTSSGTAAPTARTWSAGTPVGSPRSACAPTARAAQRPELVVTDVRMPPDNTDDGLRAAIELRRRWPGLPVLVLSQYIEQTYATELLQADPAGIGYLLKDRVSDVADFGAALSRVAA